MPSGGSIPGEIALNARPRSPLASGRDGIFPVATDLQPNLEKAIAEALKGLQYGP